MMYSTFKPLSRDPRDFALDPEVNWYGQEIQAAAVVELELTDTNIFARPHRLTNAGDAIDGHAHNFDHVTFCARGRLGVETEVDGVFNRRVILAGSGIVIRAHLQHTLVALEPDTFYVCLYAHRSPQGETSARMTGWDEAYL